MESQSFYVLAAGDEVSPIFESPLSLFRPDAMGAFMEQQYRIPVRRLTGICSRWAAKRLDQFDGGLSKFSVVKMYPSKLRQIGVAKTKPGDENNQDISVKASSGMLEEYPNLSAYVARGEARPAYKRAFAAQLAVVTAKRPTG
jgi:predicted Ser/Thr protein kinase